MKEMVVEITRKGNTLITALGIMALALVMLVGVAGAVGNNTSAGNALIIANVNVGHYPQGVALTLDESRVYVPNLYSNNVSVIDTATNNVTGNISVGSEPTGIAITPNGKSVYVTNYGSDNVSVIDTSTDTVITSINVGSRPDAIAVSPDGAKIYVSNYIGNTVSVIDTATNKVTASVPVGIGPERIAVSPNGNAVYVTNYYSNNVSVIDTATNTVTSSVNVGTNPMGIAITPDGKKIYVANSMSNNISVIDTATNNVIAMMNVSNGPGIAISPDGERVYIAEYISDIVSVADTSTNNFIYNITVGSNPKAIAFNKAGTRIYVANEGNDTVSVLMSSPSIPVSTPSIPVSTPSMPVSTPSTSQTVDLTGVWSCDDGGTYYIRQSGDSIWWFGEPSTNPSRWSNVANGTIRGSIINLVWSDVPKGCTLNNGILVLSILSKDKLTATDKTGGFGGSNWTRIAMTTCPSSTNTGQVSTTTGSGTSTAGTGTSTAGLGNQGSLNPWEDPSVRQLIDEWIRQQDGCLKKVYGPGAFIDQWGRACGNLGSTSISCNLPPDHPADWDSYHYLWVNNWCPMYYPYTVQSYVKYRQTGYSFDSMAKCKEAVQSCTP
jgi:YVTN family beta-propeller protein